MREDGRPVSTDFSFGDVKENVVWLRLPHELTEEHSS
jgi:hypothetical protein